MPQHQHWRTFGQLLREFRRRAGLTQAALAERAGLSARGIADLERGLRRFPYADTVEHLAEALELDSAERAAFEASARRHVAHPPGAQRLPTPATRLIGRERELEELADNLLRAHSRLVTVTGPGGSGKTRLALSVAERVRSSFPHGAIFVDLAPLSSSALVLPTIAQAIGLNEASGQSLTDRLADALAARHVLLVLDNCEHVASAASEIRQLLDRAPHVHVLATSRAPLHLRIEQLYPLQPLAVPATGDVQSPAALSRVPAVGLFVERAQAVQPRFVLDERNAAAVADICRRLDGLPLAIELAAARSDVLPPNALLERLQGHLALLRTDRRDDQPRHRSLHATMSWSYELLTPEEQLLLSRLSVFAGGWTLEAAEHVCAGSSIEASTVFEMLVRLVEHSLVIVTERDGQVRYGLFETIRQFAAECLGQGDEESAVRARHRDWYLAQAEQSTALGEADTQDAHALGAEFDNLRAGLRWSRDQMDAPHGLQLGVAVWNAWYHASMYTEGRAWFSELLQLPGASESPARVLALILAGHLAYCECDLTGGRDLAKEGLRLARSRQDATATAIALQVLGLIAYAQGDPTAARPMFEEALQLNQSQGLRRWQTYNRTGLAWVCLQSGEYDQARALAETNLDFYEQREDHWGIASSLRTLGLVAAAQQAFARAHFLCDRALAAYRITNDTQGMGRVLDALAHIAEAEGDPSRAWQFATDELQLARESGDRVGLAHAFAILAVLLVDTEPLRAVRLVGAAARLRESVGASVLPRERQQQDQWLRDVRARLGDETFTSEYAAGRAMLVDEMCVEALKPLPAAESS
jgi:predicted ATPase